MMKKYSKSFLVIALSGLFFVSCEKLDASKLDVQDLTGYYPAWFDQTKAQKEMTQEINGFTYKLYREVFEDRDIFISPFSISTGLSMLATGSDGNTEQQILSALGFGGKTSDDLDTYYSVIMKNMESSDPTTTISVASGIWSGRDIELKHQYVEACGKYFNSAARSVDFSDPATLLEINRWAREHTNGKIEKLLDELPADASSILANAVYFKATWPFEFTRRGNRMIAKVKTEYFEGDGFTGVKIPYGNGSFAMRIIQPAKGRKLEDAVKEYNGKASHNETAIVALDLPVFSFSYENRLNQALNNLGIEDAFDADRADFSRMSDKPMFVDDVFHRTHIDVNEKGTEAAAVVEISMLSGASSLTIPEYRELDFKVDRDFIFEIVDRCSDVTIFIGQHKM